MNILTLFIMASGIWVYWDASENKIGRIPGAKGSTNTSAGSWGVVTLGLWIVGFPMYLMNRTRLIEAAKENPVESGARPLKALMLAIPLMLYVFFEFQAALSA
jgi:hypothetical protein